MNKKLKFIHKNPTETEKLMYANHGLYPIEKKPLFVNAGENSDYIIGNMLFFMQIIKKYFQKKYVLKKNI